MKFLEEHPEWKEKVVFILNIVPSRDFITAYIERKKADRRKGKHHQWQILNAALATGYLPIQSFDRLMNCVPFTR